jgi:hypothetical protein
MGTVRTVGSPGIRIRLGTAVLTAAKSVNVKPVKARLDAFQRAQRAYAGAQDKVEAAEAALHAAHERLAQRDREQDNAVDVLARALIAEGQSRSKPFAGYGGPTPAVLINMPAGEAAQQIHALVTALQRNSGLSKATQQAIAAADKAAHATEKVLAPIEALQATAREARQARDALAQSWDKAVAALKRGARAAIDDGEPYLYAMLFGQGARASRSSKPAPDIAPPPAPTPPVPSAA